MDPTELSLDAGDYDTVPKLPVDTSLQRSEVRVPDDLLKLKGIGRKCADIMMNFQYDIPTVAVDTHVHRVVNRLGMVDTTTHEQTADALNEVTPQEFKQHGHEWLIQHGMKVCVSRKPKCDECPLTQWCEFYRNR